jgi:hypothetical protein
VVYEKTFDKFTEISHGQVTIDKNLVRMLHISCTIAINNKKLEKETKKFEMSRNARQKWYLSP